MNVASIASAFIAAQASQLQMAAAAQMLRMDNAGASADATKLLQAAQQGFDRLANVASGVGTHLDISV